MAEKREITYLQAINEALREEMQRDENVILMGEDIGIYENIFKVTRGLYKEFGPERVRDTPISENAIIGAALGASLLGFRPVVEIMHMDFLNECGDQLINHLPKIHFMSGGKLKTPVTVRTQYSLGRYIGAQHSQFFPAFFMNVPRLNIIVPSTPYDAKGLLKTAIRGNTPSLYLEGAVLYSTKGSVPTDDYTVPLGKSKIILDGEQVTIVTFGMTVPTAVSAAEKLRDEGISVMVLDARTLSPLDKEGILKAVKKTGRLVIVEADCKTAGAGAEISALVAEEAIDYLDAPIIRVASPDVPAPFTPPLLDQYLSNEEKIIKAIKQVIR